MGIKITPPEPPHRPYTLIGAIFLAGMLIVAAVVANAWGWL